MLNLINILLHIILFAISSSSITSLNCLTYSQNLVTKNINSDMESGSFDLLPSKT